MLDTHKKNGVLRYSAVTALQEHLLMGYPITYLEAQLLFGVRNLTVELSSPKKGYLIMSGVVPMARGLEKGQSNGNMFSALKPASYENKVH